MNPATAAARVAVVRRATRRGAASEALALLAHELKGRVPAGGEVLLKPNLVSHKVQLPSTHVETFAAALDALFSAGAGSIVVAEGASDATAGFDRFGLRREAAGLPVRFLDINREETEWVPLELVGVDGKARVARVSRTVAEAPCRVSLALAKTHVTSIVTLSLKNMLSSIHPQDRVMMHGFDAGGNGYRGWKRWAVEFLKGDSPAVRQLTRALGVAMRCKGALKALARGGGDPFEQLLPKELAYLRSVVAMNRNLAALAGRVGPHLGVVDGFVGMQGEGPRHGNPVPLRTVIAGADAVATDAVAAAVMGFDPREIGYLLHAEAAGLGTADLGRIEVLGDPIAAVRRRFRRHSNDRVQRHWRRLDAPTTAARGPHFPTQAATKTGAVAR